MLFDTNYYVIHNPVNVDYSITDTSVVFSGAGAQECFSVGVVDDSAYEDLEMFTITMSSADPRVQFSQQVVTISIRDNDSM